MNRIAKRAASSSLGVCLLLLTTSTLSNAADRVIFAPAGGWSFPQGGPSAASSSQVAVVAYRGEWGVDFESRIMQREDSEFPTIKVTDVPGKVIRLNYSSDGQLLLADALDPTITEGTTRSYLIASSGVIQWTRDQDGYLNFSPTGQIVFSWDPPSSSRINGASELTMLDTSGDVVREVDLGGPVGALTISGDGSHVVMAKTHTLISINVSASPPTVDWKVELDPSDPFVAGFRAVDNNRFVVDQHFGRFIVMKFDGTLEYRFNPENLGAADPNRDWREYTTYGAYPGETSSTLTLYNGSATAFTLTPSTGQLSERSINAATPSGFLIQWGLQSQTVVMISPAQVRFRDP